MSLPESGGYARWEDYQRIEAQSLNRTGTMALQTIFDAVLGSLTYDHAGAAPRSGFFGRSLQPSITGASMVVTIAPGMGVRYDASETDEYVPHIKPFVLAAADTITADASDPTNDRIDIISVAENDTDDQSATRYIKNPSTSVVSPQTVDTRTSLGATLTYTAGTPAGSPVAPATPAGHIKICEFTVAAAASVVSSLVDSREQLVMPGQLPRSVAHSAFRSENGADMANELHLNGANYWLETGKAAAISHNFQATVFGLDGLRVNEITCYANLSDTAATCVYQLRRTEKSTGATTLLAAATITGATGVQSDTQDLDHVFDDEGYYYILRVVLTNSAGGSARLYGISLA